MATNTLNTKILLCYDTYNHWMTSERILQPGEAAVATFPGLTANSPPRAFGLKIGDGERYFDELPWVQAMAIDVYEWAKDPQKPVYTAQEIQGLAEFIAQQTGGGSGGGSGTSSGAYQIIYDSANFKYILQQWNTEDSAWEDTASEINLKDIFDRIDTIERWANGAQTHLGRIEMPLISYIYEAVSDQLALLTRTDNEVAGEFVTSVSQEEGLISVTHAPINASLISLGTLSTAHGGTGLTRVEEDELLIGSLDGNITKKSFVTTIDPTSTNNFSTTGAIVDYVTEATAGLNRAMHFIGESSVLIDRTHLNVNPNIPGYDFSKVQEGDTVIANNNQEFIWNGSYWHLIGQSYALKGQIMNSDIADNANITITKIENLNEILNEKVNLTDISAERTKLATIEESAQVNLIEHITVNGSEVSPDAEKIVNLTIPVLTNEQLAHLEEAQANVIEHIFINGDREELQPMVINSLPKSINIEFVMTQEEKEKIDALNLTKLVHTISFNHGEPLEPDVNHNIDITIDASALQLTVLEGAQYPITNSNTFVPISTDESGKILILSKIAATGDIDDLLQTTSYVTFNCGSSETVI